MAAVAVVVMMAVAAQLLPHGRRCTSRSAAWPRCGGCAGPDAPRRLWIDAVCIDQGSVAERNHQLGLMTRIYSGAGRVVAYLGERGGDSDAAMDWIREVDEPSDFDEPPRHDEPPRVAQPDPAMMVALLGRAWFGRVWVIQEVAAARDAVVVCGDREVRWAAFRAFRYWNHTTRWVRELPFAVDSALALHATPQLRAAALRLAPVPEARHHPPLRRHRPPRQVLRILPLLQLEEAYFRAAQAARGDSSDDDDEPDDDKPEAAAAPRPAKWPPALRSADYSLPAVRVFTELARSLIDGVGLGAVLRTVVLPAAVPGLPSWAPDWSVTPVQTSSRAGEPAETSSAWTRSTSPACRGPAPNPSPGALQSTAPRRPRARLSSCTRSRCVSAPLPG